jgi:DegV family protein with EDD domain
MSKVKIVIDSTTYLPNELIEKYDMRVAPAVVIWKGEQLLDGIDISPSEFYTRLQNESELPTTSQATPAAFKDIYDALLADGDDILGVLVSHKLSGMMNSAEQAMAMLPDANIQLIDTLSVSMGVGWPAIAAARAASKGMTLSECRAFSEKACENIGVLFSVDTLEFLHRGGRIGGAQRFIGAALNFKPILEIQDGAIEALERVRTQKKALVRLVNLVVERIGGRSPVYLAVMHANAPERAQKLLEDASAVINPVETVIADLSPGVGTHAGPGTVALAFLAGVEMP